MTGNPLLVFELQQNIDYKNSSILILSSDRIVDIAMDSPTDKHCAQCGKTDDLFELDTVPDRFGEYIFCREGGCVGKYSKYVYGGGMELSIIPFNSKHKHQPESGKQLICKLCGEQSDLVLYAHIRKFRKTYEFCCTHPREVVECFVNYLNAVEKMNSVLGTSFAKKVCTTFHSDTVKEGSGDSESDSDLEA